MRSIIKQAALIFCGAMALCFQCEKEYSPICTFFIGNYTDRALTISISSTGDDDPIQMAINPGGSRVVIHGFVFRDNNTEAAFGQMLEMVFPNLEGGKVDVLSTDDMLLKTWSFSSKDLPCKQFFKESSWQHYQEHKGEYLRYTWVFDILPEDIVYEHES